MTRHLIFFAALSAISAGPALALHSPEPGLIDKDLPAPVFGSFAADALILPQLAAITLDEGGKGS